MTLKSSGKVENEHSSTTSSSKDDSFSSSGDKIKLCNEGLLIVRHVLRQVQMVLEPSQNIFHTRFLISNKVCSLIIDGESSVNVASTKIVDKLGLETILHAKPYKLACISKKDEIKENKQVHISFSIKNYMNEVLCDIVPLDKVLILLRIFLSFSI